MSLVVADRIKLQRLAKDHWIEAQATLCAYERDYKKNRSINQWLRRGTLISAIATALSAATPWTQIVLTSGIITAVMSAIDQAFSPAKQAQAFWECRGKLEGIKRDIISCAIVLDAAPDLAAGMEPLKQIASRLTEVTQLPFDKNLDDDLAAQTAFEDSVLAHLLSECDLEKTEREGGPLPLGLDAPGVIAVRRKRVLPSGARS